MHNPGPYIQTIGKVFFLYYMHYTENMALYCEYQNLAMLCSVV